MNTFHRIHRVIVLATCLAILCWMVPASAEPTLSREEKEEFLSNAKVIRSERIGKGVTDPYRLTLREGDITHDGAFQDVWLRENYKTFSDGTTEINFVDSYLYNIAAYKLAILLGLEDMVPVTVERKWSGKIGALSWWLTTQMDEAERLEDNIRPPDVEAFNRQMHKNRVFRELVYDSDLNASNVMIGENWELYMIDFSRAFRLYRKLRNPENLERCSRELMSRLQELDQDTLSENTRDLLTKSEVEGVMARRDLILERFNELIAEKGEEAVLY